MAADGTPIVGIPCDVFERGRYPFHGVGEKYVDAVACGFGAVPLLLPATGGRCDSDAPDDAVRIGLILDILDGVLLPGSPSNVEPWRYDGPESTPGTLHDPQRDARTLPLIPQALARGVPLLCICRGMQELNVALGGTLHQRVCEVPGMLDHRGRVPEDPERQYAGVHQVTIEPGGVFETLFEQDSFVVNSVHGQGVEHLAPALRAEARAPDGLIEAVSVRDARSFAVGVQWHPEWRFRENSASMKLFAAFTAAVRSRHATRTAIDVRSRIG